MKPEKTKMTVLALQHVLAMYAGAVIVPIITGSSLNEQQAADVSCFR